MTPLHKRRLWQVIIILSAVAISVGFAISALRQNINLFFTPGDLLQQDVTRLHRFKLGGMVKIGSVKHSKENLSVYFTLTDLTHDIPVSYEGILPDLFKEGQGVVAEGYLTEQGIFQADQILAKHDNVYMPKPLMEKLQSSGYNIKMHSKTSP